MKKVSKIISILVLIIIVILGLFFLNKKEDVLETVDDTKSNLISMMIEQEDGTYRENANINFVSKGYLFNPNKSGCENGGTLSWNNTKEKVEASLLTSDKCYAYFDIYNLEKYCAYTKEESLVCEVIKKKDNALIYHDGKCDYDSEENCNLEAEDYSYRYTGGNPNNYICFGGECSADPNDSNYKNLYRIIGFFQNEREKYEIKIIKSDATTKEDLGEGTFPNSAYLGDYNYTKNNYKGKLSNFASYAWNNTSGTTKDANNVNMWKESNLNTKNLNEIYYNRIDSKYQKMIVSHEWQVGGYSYTDEIAKTTYDYELGPKKLTSLGDKCYNQEDANTKRLCDQANDLTYNGNIGLMYQSDYMYATLPKFWNITAKNYEQEDLLNNNWLYLGLDEWTISRYSNHALNAKIVNSAGNAYHSSYIYVNLIARPVLYLSTDTKLKLGEGSSENPYRIAI